MPGARSTRPFGPWQLDRIAEPRRRRSVQGIANRAGFTIGINTVATGVAILFLYRSFTEPIGL